MAHSSSHLWLFTAVSHVHRFLDRTTAGATYFSSSTHNSLKKHPSLVAVYFIRFAEGRQAKRVEEHQRWYDPYLTK